MMTYILINTLATVFGLLIGIRVYCICYVWGKSDPKVQLKGKTVIITGSNSGIGKATAHELVRRGARVVMACRDRRATETVINQMNNNNPKGLLIYKHIDLSSFSSVKRFADDINQTEKSVDILINNAAVFGPPFGLTEDGFETQFQVNHLSNALLTLLLLPKLNSSSDPNQSSRVLMLTSTLYRSGIIRDNDFTKGFASEENYEKKRAYNNSKLANILFSRCLHQKIISESKSIDILMTSPGIVWTNLGRHMGLKWWQLLLLSPFALLFLRTAKQGSQTVVHCATAHSLTADRLYRNCCQQKWDSIPSDTDLSNKVYNMTVKAIEPYLK